MIKFDKNYISFFTFSGFMRNGQRAVRKFVANFRNTLQSSEVRWELRNQLGQLQCSIVISNFVPFARKRLFVDALMYDACLFTFDTILVWFSRLFRRRSCIWCSREIRISNRTSQVQYNIFKVKYLI